MTCIRFVIGKSSGILSDISSGILSTCSWASHLQVVFPLVSLMKDGADGEVDVTIRDSWGGM